MGTAAMAAADVCYPTPGPSQGDDHVRQEGLVDLNVLNNVDVSPNLGCLADQTVPDLTAQGLVGLVPVGVSLNHLLEHANLNVLANGNTTTDVYDNSCTSNQGTSQAGNNSHSAIGASDSSSNHSTGNGSGANNSQAGEGAGGLLGGTGVLGTGL
jgi:hypothetical protein